MVSAPGSRLKPRRQRQWVYVVGNEEEDRKILNICIGIGQSESGARWIQKPFSLDKAALPEKKSKLLQNLPRPRSFPPASMHAYLTLISKVDLAYVNEKLYGFEEQAKDDTMLASCYYK